MEESKDTLLKNVGQLFKEQKFVEIMALLTNEELENHRDARLYAWKARANHRLGYDIGLTLLLSEKAIDVNRTYYMGYFCRALVWSEKKENDKAIEDYNKTIEFNPNFADAYFNRGVIWQNKKENDKAIEDYNKAIVNYNIDLKIDPAYAEAYFYRGFSWYNIKNYDYAIADYTKVIEINSDYEIAYYNRGLAWFALKKYDKAIEDYTKIIKPNSKYADIYYNDRGNAWRGKKEYNKAIDDYSEAIKINPAFENAYYYRGLAKKEQNSDLEGSKQDFEKYLKLTNDDNDIGVKYAKYYIKKIDEINDKELFDIGVLISKIKNTLRLDDECITHYTSLSVLKSLILDCSKFRISEGNFMNDPSEGSEFFNFMYGNSSTLCNDCSSVKNFSPKPFIGSFVAKDMYDDLNMWRFYGKENGEEAKGCAITLHMQNFIEGIKDFLSNEKNKEARLDDESDINFYQVAYLKHGSSNFYIPNSVEKSLEIEELMIKLRDKVDSYKGNNTTSLEEYLNSLAFVFKSDAYKNENEVRLVVKGIEFEKEYNMDVYSPRVYIELVSIKDIVSQITLGPKVDKISEWKVAFHYRYEKNKAPEIKQSHLPYK